MKMITKYNNLFAVIPENMSMPIAIFLNKSQAQRWKDKEYGNRAVIRACQDVALYLQALSQCCNNQ